MNVSTLRSHRAAQHEAINASWEIKMKKLICGIAVAVLFSGAAYAGNNRSRYYSGYSYNPNRNVNIRYVSTPRPSTFNAGMSSRLPNGTGQ